MLSATETPLAVLHHVIRCIGKPQGKYCRHIVARIPNDEWLPSRLSSVEIECRHCGKVASLAQFVIDSP